MVLLIVCGQIDRFAKVGITPQKGNLYPGYKSVHTSMEKRQPVHIVILYYSYLKYIFDTGCS